VAADGRPECVESLQGRDVNCEDGSENECDERVQRKTPTNSHYELRQAISRLGNGLRHLSGLVENITTSPRPSAETTATGEVSCCGMTRPLFKRAMTPSPPTYSGARFSRLAFDRLRWYPSLGFRVLDVEATALTPRRYRRAFRAVDRFAAQYMREINAPGMTLARADKERLLYTTTYGFSDPARKERVRQEELFFTSDRSRSPDAANCTPSTAGGRQTRPP
jgi:hypothetical protein